MSLLRRPPKVITDEGKILDLLTRGVEEIFVRESLLAKLRSGKRLRVKLGFDPTGKNIHIGRAIILRKLRAFQDLGHEAIFVVGDFTARVGDPSDKLEKRPMLESADVKKNLVNYKKQVGRILNLSQTTFCFNGKWLSRLDFSEIAELAEAFSVQQMTNRRNFKERLDQGEEISLREFLYPLMQGYDSVAVRADVEIGGFDQLFNLKAGRNIQKHYGQPEQDILTTTMLPGTDGRKMSTSWGNVININDDSNEMFGKVMSLRDDLIGKYFLLCTDLPEGEVKSAEERLGRGENPRDIKMWLAREIVSMYHGKKKAQAAEENFIAVFSRGAAPKDIPELQAARGTPFSDALVRSGIISSKSEWQRLISEGAVRVLPGELKMSDPRAAVEGTVTLRVGKHRFVKIIVRQ